MLSSDHWLDKSVINWYLLTYFFQACRKQVFTLRYDYCLMRSFRFMVLTQTTQYAYFSTLDWKTSALLENQCAWSYLTQLVICYSMDNSVANPLDIDWLFSHPELPKPVDKTVSKGTLTLRSLLFGFLDYHRPDHLLFIF